MTKQQISTALVFASYKEAENLSDLLHELSAELSERILIVIADDSGVDYQQHLEEACRKSSKAFSGKLEFNYSDSKEGRGAAVRRAFADIRARYPGITSFIEADSDGSHRADDILKLYSSDSYADLLIGSRYIKNSQIIGWPISRRILSRFLNTVIPLVLNVPAKDLTNGLRRYSLRAVDMILIEPARNNGFIYLSEVALMVSNSGMSIEEVPIRFENRVHGSSTVGLGELSNSLSGLLGLILKKTK